MTKSFFYSIYPTTCCNSSYDDKNLISSSKDHSAIVWRFNEDDKIEWSLVGHTDVVTCADFISNELVATTSYDSTLRFWKLS
jgi:WD40 repeat protein